MPDDMDKPGLLARDMPHFELLQAALDAIERANRAREPGWDDLTPMQRRRWDSMLGDLVRTAEDAKGPPLKGPRILVCPVCGHVLRDNNSPLVQVFCEGPEDHPHAEAEMKRRHPPSEEKGE